MRDGTLARGASLARLLCGRRGRRRGIGRNLGDAGCSPSTLRALTQRMNGLLKIVEGIKLSIDRSEAQVGDDIQVPQER